MNSSSPWFQLCWGESTVGFPLGWLLCPMVWRQLVLGVSRKLDRWATVICCSAIGVGEDENCLRVVFIPHLGDNRGGSFT